MKVTAPKDPTTYFGKTEHAVKHFYAGLESCWSYYKHASEHWDISQLDQPMTPERRAGLDRYLELAGEYFRLKFSEAAFAGSILQVAYMAIQLYSRNKTIPPNCANLVLPSNKKAIPFCIGSERHTVPIGLLVYAGRNQYSHWDEDHLRDKVNRQVFAALSRAFRDNMFADLAFSLANPGINVYAGEVLLTALAWRSYDSYLAAMTALLE
jgi:hypothetical protein